MMTTREEGGWDTGAIVTAAEHEARRVAQMAVEVCSALGINAPGEDAVANWPQVLEAISRRVALLNELDHHARVLSAKVWSFRGQGRMARDDFREAHNQLLDVLLAVSSLRYEENVEA